ncbi:Sua5/YciO/YrdC/YwlC family protein, partial [Nanoarchaeota archaeon]
DATNTAAVNKLKKLKGNKIFSIIAPSKRWIRQNCTVNDHIEDHLEMLPGRYTLVLNLREGHKISKDVNNGLNTIGIRIPRSWSHEISALLNRPLATSAAPASDEHFMTCMENLSRDIRNHIDFCIYDGEIKGRSISVIKLTN